jgi:hypothetical protein
MTVRTQLSLSLSFADIINAETISMMKDGVVIINTSRGALVDAAVSQSFIITSAHTHILASSYALSCLVVSCILAPLLRTYTRACSEQNARTLASSSTHVSKLCVCEQTACMYLPLRHQAACIACIVQYEHGHVDALVYSSSSKQHTILCWVLTYTPPIQAVDEGLKSKKIGGLAMDVYENESSYFFRKLHSTSLCA